MKKKEVSKEVPKEVSGRGIKPGAFGAKFDTAREEVERGNRILHHLLVKIPTYLFVAMVSKSGFSTTEKQNMCIAFKNIKDLGSSE